MGSKSERNGKVKNYFIANKQLSGRLLTIKQIYHFHCDEKPGPNSVKTQKVKIILAEAHESILS